MFRTNKHGLLFRSFSLTALVCTLAFLSVVSARAIFRSYATTTPSGAIATSTSANQASAPQDKARPKSLKQRALERDVEVESTAESNLGSVDLPALASGASAIILGKITHTKSFFDESGDPKLEYGDIITTEYDVEVQQIFKNTTLETQSGGGKLAPAALTTPLKIARNGGVVVVNGHKAAVKVKGYEALLRGHQYVFFLNWSPDYKAYVLSYGIFGAIAVDEDRSLRPLAGNDEIKSSFRKLNLDTLAAEINR